MLVLACSRSLQEPPSMAVDVECLSAVDASVTAEDDAKLRWSEVEKYSPRLAETEPFPRSMRGGIDAPDAPVMRRNDPSSPPPPAVGRVLFSSPIRVLSNVHSANIGAVGSTTVVVAIAVALGVEHVGGGWAAIIDN